MRGGAVSAAVAASTGAREPAAGARGLALPREKLLYRGQVSRARRFEKFLLLPHLKSQIIRRRRGEKGKTGTLDCLSEIPLRPPPFLSPQPQVISHYCRSYGEETKASTPMDPSIPIHGAAGGKVSSAARYQHRANFLWPVPRAPSVTSLKLPFSSAPTSLPRLPHPSCSTKKWMGINNMAPQHKNWQCLYPSCTGIT